MIIIGKKVESFACDKSKPTIIRTIQNFCQKKEENKIYKKKFIKHNAYYKKGLIIFSMNFIQWERCAKRKHNEVNK